jgi:hypothetical protein
MNMTILFLLLLCIFLVVSLGINYSNIFSQTIVNMNTPVYSSTPMVQTKYNQHDDYYLDANAAQGVFTNTLQLNNHILEPMVSGKNNLIPSDNTESWDKYKGPKGSEYEVYGENNIGSTFNGKNGKLGQLVGGCAGTQYGCCPDNVTAKNANGDNCAPYPPPTPTEPVGGCAGTQYGCCPDNVTAKHENGDNCAPYPPPTPVQPVGGCAGTQYGCCPDNVTARHENGDNCAPYPPPAPTPVQPVGGCAGTQYGCCPDNVTAKNAMGDNCVSPNPLQPVGGCAGTQYGCCPDGVTAKNATGDNCISYPPPNPPPPSCASSQYGCCLDGMTAKNAYGTNCATFNSWTYNVPTVTPTPACNTPTQVSGPVPAPLPSPSVQSGCSVTQYGCCPDNVTAKNTDGSNCSAANAWKYTGPNVTVYGVTGQDKSGFVAQGPQGNTFYGSTNTIGGCAGTQYGCCPDNVTAKYADGSNCPSTEPKPQVGGCAGTQYGCCPDNITAKYADGSNCPPTEPIPAPQVGGCAGTQYGCCPDNITAKNTDGSNCSSYPPPPVQTSTVFIPPPKGLLTVENNSYDTNSNYESVESKSKSTATCPEPSPCPPCGRCPEPSFDCKKVPNYASTNSEYLPMPVLSDFSQFGM